MSEQPHNPDSQAHNGDGADQWYVQQGSRLEGPYSSNDIRRYLLLGRVRSNDRVSRDGELWEPVTQVPELIPEELLDLDSEKGWHEYLQKYTLADERSVETSHAHLQAHTEDPRFTAPQFNYHNEESDRRILSELEATEKIRDDWTKSESEQPAGTSADQQPVSLLPLSLLGLTLLALLVVIYLNTVSPLL